MLTAGSPGKIVLSHFSYFSSTSCLFIMFSINLYFRLLTSFQVSPVDLPILWTNKVAGSIVWPVQGDPNVFGKQDTRGHWSLRLGV
jgi:hypothetical protein